MNPLPAVYPAPATTLLEVQVTPLFGQRVKQQNEPRLAAMEPDPHNHQQVSRPSSARQLAHLTELPVSTSAEQSRLLNGVGPFE